MIFIQRQSIDCSKSHCVLNFQVNLHSLKDAPKKLNMLQNDLDFVSVQLNWKSIVSTVIASRGREGTIHTGTYQLRIAISCWGLGMPLRSWGDASSSSEHTA